MSETAAEYTVLTFKRICQQYPEIAEIQRDAKRLSRNHPDYWLCYSRLQRRLSSLIGWDAGSDFNQDAYNLAYSVIFKGM